MATARLRSSNDKRPSACPARTFKTVIWKLTNRPETQRP
jgi:hypothetical protein